MTVKQTKTRKVIKAHLTETPQKLEVGQHIILKTGFTYGCHRGAIYEIVSLDHDRVDCLKMGRKLDKHVTSYTQRGNRFCAGQDKFMRWVETNAIGFVELREETEPTRWRKQSSDQSNRKPKSKVAKAMSTPSGRMSTPEIRHQSGWSSSLQKLDKENLRQGCKTDA